MGCYSAGDGITPPEDRIYFPVGLALANDAQHLLVANSDFDLQYNSGTLNVVDVTALRDFVPPPCVTDDDCSASAATCSDDPDAYCRQRVRCTPTSRLCAVDAAELEPCGVLGERSAAEQLLAPGLCNYVDPAHPPAAPVGSSPFPSTLLKGAGVEIGAFATDIVYRARPASLPATSPDGVDLAGRAFIPVRGDATLHWVDIGSDGSLNCGQRNGGGCDDLHRAGNNTDENSRELRLGPEPFALDASPAGEAVLVTNQTTGTVSLFVNDWVPSEGPTLEFAVTGLPARPVGVAALPTPAYVPASNAYYPPGFLVSFRSAPEVDLIRYYDDRDRNPRPGEATDPNTGAPFPRAYASRTGASAITINSVGTDSRGIAVDSTARAVAEKVCLDAAGVTVECLGQGSCVPSDATALSNCLQNASATPLDVFVANRTPSTLLLGRTTPARNALENTEVPNFYDSIPLTLGPSRVVLGNVIVGRDASGGNILERRVFVVCFDSRRIFIYDPLRRRLDAEISTGRGPHALAIDDKRGWLFIGHFTDSFISVVSLDRRFPITFGKTLATVGKPTPPRASK